MSGEQPNHRQKQEKAAQEQREAQEHSDRQQIVIALQRVAEQQEASDKEAKRADRFHRLAEKLALRLESRKYWVDLSGVAGIYVAASVAIWAVLDAQQSVKNQIDAMTAQQSVMQSQLDEMKAEQRPWISFSVEIVGDSQMDVGGLPFAFGLSLTNVGHLPALNVALYGEIHSANVLTRLEIAAVQKRICEPLRNKSEGPVAGGITVFPGETKKQGITITLSQQDIAADVALFPLPERLKGKAFPVVDPVFIGCIDYRSPGDSRHHQDGLVYSISAPGQWGAGLIGGGVPIIKDILPKDRIRLAPYLWDGRVFYTD